MAWATCDAAFQIVSVTHGDPAVTIADPLAFSVREEIEFLPIRAGTILGPICRPVVAKDVAAACEALELDDTIAADVKGPLVITLKQADGGSTVITITNMKRGSVTWNGNSPPYTKQLEFVHEGAMASSPISVTV